MKLVTNYNKQPKVSFENMIEAYDSHREDIEYHILALHPLSDSVPTNHLESRNTLLFSSSSSKEKQKQWLCAQNTRRMWGVVVMCEFYHRRQRTVVESSALRWASASAREAKRKRKEG